MERKAKTLVYEYLFDRVFRVRVVSLEGMKGFEFFRFDHERKKPKILKRKMDETNIGNKC